VVDSSNYFSVSMDAGDIKLHLAVTLGGDISNWFAV